VAETTAPAGPVGTEQLRRTNTALVLRSLRFDGPATRSELARRTGLAKATVGVIVSGLDAVGVVSEGVLDEPVGRGRPGRPVALRDDALVGLGLELNVDYLSLVLLDLTGEVRRHEHRPRSTSDGAADLLALVRSVMREYGAARVVGAMVAVPGLVRGDDVTVAWAPNLAVDGAALVAALAAELGCPVTITNDANAAAYAESRHGAAVGIEHAVYLTGTVGIGAGVVVDGRPLRGAAGFAGEVGHMPIGDSTAPCGCGRRGCWEASIGLRAMLARVGLPELDTPLSSAEAVARHADEPAVAAGLDAVGRDLGRGLATIAHLLNPAVVVLGGYFVPLGERLLAPAREALAARLPAEVGYPELRLSGLGIEAAATGAAELALDGVFLGEVPLA
jgi:predicted NBD/HSP70 family sugar kinase